VALADRETAAEHIRNALTLVAFGGCAEADAITARLRAALREVEAGNMKNPGRFVPSFRPGERVEIAPRFDQWMRGDRYGDVVKQSQRFGVYVKMDKSGKTLRFAPEDLTAINAPTRKARVFIARKIRTLAHEGRRAPARVAAAYSLARRRGFKAPRKNPRAYSESEAWELVLSYAKRLRKPNAPRAQLLWYITNVAEEMLAQVQRGVHENPTLAVLGNPPAKVVGTLSRRLYELRYKHASDGKDYRHPFGPGASVLLLADGSVLIRSKQRLWEDL
jgi:hypothetical protein